MKYTVLIVDDEENARLFTGTFLTGQGHEVFSASTAKEARDYIRQGKADIIVLDVVLPDGNGLTLLEEIGRLSFRPPVIMFTGNGDIKMAVDAMKNGAFDFLEKPITLTQLEETIQRAGETVSMRRELTHFRQSQHQDLDYIIGKSQKMITLYEYAQRVAATCVSVLITGETGTGKDVLVRAIHKMGPRSQKPMVAENCAAIQSTVMESELFGYEAGAFTGAEKRKHGLMEVADGGILFLDEISSMPVDMQAKILRALEERAFRRVGGTNLIHVDVQIVAASNRPLLKLIEENRFREDLYYRLKVVNLDVPPLREHKEDIPDLVGHFIHYFNAKMGLNITDVAPRVIEALMAHSWPGNIRELRNVIEHAMTFCDEPVIDLPHIPGEYRNFNASA